MSAPSGVPRKPVSPPRSRRLVLIGTALLGIGISVGSALMLRVVERKNVQEEFTRAAQERVAAISQGFEAGQLAVKGVGALFNASQVVERQEFARFTRQLLDQSSSLKALEWVPMVDQTRRAAYEQAARADGLTEFAFRERSGEGRMRPAAPRPHYFPVYYLEPLVGNEAALGYDLGSEEERLAALQRAAASGKLAATSPLTLVQSDGDAYGLLLFFPIYRKGVPLSAVAERRQNLVGFVLGVFHVGGLVEGALSYLEPRGIDIYLYEATAPGRETLLYFHPSRSRSDRVEPLERSRLLDGLHLSQTLALGDRSWEVFCVPSARFVQGGPLWWPLVALIAGLLVTGLLLAYLEGLFRNLRAGFRHAEELQRANEILAGEMRARRSVEEAVAERAHLAQLAARISGGLAGGGPLEAALQSCAEALVEYLGAAFARIWTFNEPEEMLELRASAGLYTHIDGPHSRIPLGHLKVGIIAQLRKPHLTNRVQGDPLINDQEWARREGMVAFAGYPLELEGRLVGVIALFSRQPLSQVVLATLASVADQIAVGTDRSNAESRLRSALAEVESSRDRLSAILHSVSDGLIVTDTGGRVILMNPATENLFGVSLADSFGRPVEEVLSALELPQAAAAKIAGGGPDGAVDWHLAGPGDGDVRTLEVRTSPAYSREQGPLGVVTILRDVTRERESERLKSEFISTAAHELRTPLTSIKGFSELLLEESAAEGVDRQEALAIIFQKSEVLERIIDDLLDLSRVETGWLIRLAKVPCDLVPLLRRDLEACAREFDDYRFTADIPAALPLEADPHKIEQVMANLLSNAVKFSPPGTSVEVRAERVAGEVRVSVQDQGPGMEPEHVPRIFEKFFRIDASSTAKAGLGLGLSVAKAIVEAHGGRIWAESAPGKGTRVVFTLPAPPGCGPSPG